LKNSHLINLNHYLKYFPVVIFTLFVIILTPSCGNVKNLQYLQGSFDTARLSKVQAPEPIIQKGDILGVTVFSDDPLATAAVTNPLASTSISMGNSGGIGGAGGYSTQGASASQGYIVSQSGEVQFYKLGPISAEGKTKKQLGDTLALLYANLGLLKNPYVDVRFLNYKVTVIGEVNRPGSISIPADRLNAFEAIGLAGDITVFGRRDNILVVREINGKREFGNLNLKDPNVFLSPYYYLQQNDLLVVDVGKNKAVVNNQRTFQYVSLGASLLSIAAVFISLFRN
jgi:polysaccharide export outer membrane protein